MKRLIPVALVVALFATLGFLASQSTLAAGYGKAKPLEGIITQIASSAFQLSTKDSKTYVVKCDGTTQFLSGKEKVRPGDVIKVGAHVGVQGGQTGQNTIMANVVTILGGGNTK